MTNMINSSHLIYGNIIMLDNFLKSKKQKFEISQLCVPISITKGTLKCQNLCKILYSDVESGIYNNIDILIYFLYNKIFNPKFYILQIIKKNIPIITNLFSNSQFEIDEKFVTEFMKDNNITQISELFEIIDGSNLIFSMVIKKLISPVFYLKYYKNYKYSEESKLNDEFIIFEKIINTINLILKF